MRIKKKYVLKESRILETLLIDDLSGIPPFEKKALKYLHSIYKDFTIWDINTADIVDKIHNEWKIPLELAFKIANTYVYKRDVLFKEHDFYGGYSKSKFFEKYSHRFFRNFRDTLNNDIIEPDGWDINVGGEVLPYDTSFWESYDSFTIYLPINNEFKYRGEGWNKWDKYTILINVEFEFFENKISINYKIGERHNKQTGIIKDNIHFEYPEGDLTFDSVNKWVSDIIFNIVKPLVLNFEFPSVEDDGTGM